MRSTTTGSEFPIPALFGMNQAQDPSLISPKEVTDLDGLIPLQVGGQTRLYGKVAVTKSADPVMGISQLWTTLGYGQSFRQTGGAGGITADEDRPPDPAIDNDHISGSIGQACKPLTADQCYYLYAKDPRIITDNPALFPAFYKNPLNYSKLGKQYATLQTFQTLQRSIPGNADYVCVTLSYNPCEGSDVDGHFAFYTPRDLDAGSDYFNVVNPALDPRYLITLGDQAAGDINTLEITPDPTSIPLAGATVLTVGNDYSDTYLSNTAITFTGVPVEGSTIILFALASAVGGFTLTFPASLYLGVSITSQLIPSGITKLVWTYTSGQWVLTHGSLFTTYTLAKYLDAGVAETFYFSPKDYRAAYGTNIYIRFPMTANWGLSRPGFRRMTIQVEAFKGGSPPTVTGGDPAAKFTSAGAKKVHSQLYSYPVYSYQEPNVDWAEPLMVFTFAIELSDIKTLYYTFRPDLQ